MLPPLMGQGPRERFLAAFGSLFPEGEWTQPKLDALLSRMSFREMEAGETLLREGQSCTNVPFVVEGIIRVFKRAESGREITLYRVERGQSCILSAGCGSSLSSFPASAVVEERCTAAFLSTQVLRRLIAESESFRSFVMDQYSRRVVEVMELVEEVAFQKVDERLAQHLLDRSRLSPDASVPGTHQELADHVGTSREVVSRILKDWELRSLVELSRGSVKLLPGFETLRVRDRSE